MAKGRSAIEKAEPFVGFCHLPSRLWLAGARVRSALDLLNLDAPGQTPLQRTLPLFSFPQKNACPPSLWRGLSQDPRSAIKYMVCGH